MSDYKDGYITGFNAGFAEAMRQRTTCPLCDGKLHTIWYPTDGGPPVRDACPICEDVKRTEDRDRKEGEFLRS